MKKVVLSVKTTEKRGFYDITQQVKEVVEKSGIADGICVICVPHTTAGVNLNENCDENVVLDLKNAFAKNVPDVTFYHDEGNSDGHYHTALVGNSETVIVEDGKIQLGVWQAIYFAEFDGPRDRKVFVKIIEG